MSEPSTYTRLLAWRERRIVWTAALRLAQANGCPIEIAVRQVVEARNLLRQISPVAVLASDSAAASRGRSE